MPKSKVKAGMVDPPPWAEIFWEGDFLEVLKSWPAGIRSDFGHALRQMQQGFSATLEVRPMQSIGASVFELKTQDEKTWSRMVYLARIEDVIYVLDCFEKNSRKTAARDLKTAANRLSLVRQSLLEEKRNEKRKRNEKSVSSDQG